MYRLVISDDAGKTTVVMLVRDEITIGRADDNHICLTERNVSRHHARIVRRDDTYGVEDLGSYNGLKVNGTRIEGSLDLSAGDRVVLGDYQLRFESEVTGSMAGDEDVEIEAPLPARLVMLTSPAPGAEYALGRLPARIGRSEDIEITINHRSISREHAEFTEIDGSIVIRDLESANGLRVNGEDVGEATLTDGDVLEFGQVRFRFVGSGEEYAFDPAAPEAVADEEEEEPARLPLVGAVLILVVAVAAAAAIAIKSNHDRRARASTPTSTHAVPVPISTAAELASAIRACEEAVSAGRWEDAVRGAERAVALDSSAPAAHDCRARANAGANARSIVTSALETFRGGDVVRAYRDIERIPSTSDQLRREEVRQIALAYVTLKTTEAETAITGGDGNSASLAATEALAAVDAFAFDDKRSATAQLLERARTAPVAPPTAAGVDAGTAVAPAVPAGTFDAAAAQACFLARDLDCVLRLTEGVVTSQAYDLRFRSLARTPGRRADTVAAARDIVRRFPSSTGAQRAYDYLHPPTASP
jgi:pSer/pThr/pTyr-binding forkhead associated (FHA) protein